MREVVNVTVNGRVLEEAETVEVHKTIATAIRELRKRTVGKIRVTCECGWEGTRYELVHAEQRHLVCCPECEAVVLNPSQAVTYVEYNGGNRQRRNRAGKRHQGEHYDNSRSSHE